MGKIENKKREKKVKMHGDGKKAIYITLIIVVAVVMLLPFIIHWIYGLNPPWGFFSVSYDVSDILSYYGSSLSFIGATILGILTYRQNKKAQEKSDEVNRLQLELSKKSMAMAEAQYSNNGKSSNAIPKFEIALRGYNGNYSGLFIMLKNVSSIIASNISPISFVIQDANGEIISNGGKLTVNQRSLSSTQEAIVFTNTPNLVVKNGNKTDFFHNVKFIFSFSCEDEMSNTYYFRASILIPNTKEFFKETWSVERIG